MSISEKLITVAENQKKVYDAGYENGNDDFWDVIQQNGTRTSYMYAFHNWGCEYIRPKYKVVPTTQGLNQVFYRNTKLKKVEAEYFDFSQIPTPTSSVNSNYYTFQFCENLEEIEDIGLSDHSYSSTFFGCESLHTIARMPVKESTTFDTNIFSNCISLENITIDGIIGQNGFDVHWSEKLTHDSLMSIINALKNYSGSGTTHTITLGSANLSADKLSDAEKAIATQKGWTLAS